MGHASKIYAEPNSWDLRNTVRETEKVLLYGSAIINDRDDKRPQPPQDTSSSLTPAARKDSQRIRIVQKETFHEVRAGVLRRPNHSPQNNENNDHQPPSQRPPGNKKMSVVARHF